MGGPPTLDFDRCDRFLKPCGEPVVIGAGRHFNGGVEIVAFQSRQGLCIGVDLLRSGSFSSCPGQIHPAEGEVVSAGAFGLSSSRRSSFTQVVGAVAPEVASLRVRYRREGEPKSAKAVVAQVAGELQQRLEEEAPFAVFEITVRGCLPLERLRFSAFDAAGALVGRERLRSFRGVEDLCDPDAFAPTESGEASIRFRPLG